MLLFLRRWMFRVFLIGLGETLIAAMYASFHPDDVYNPAAVCSPLLIALLAGIMAVVLEEEWRE